MFINFNVNQNCIPTFKQSLTSYEINEVKRMGTYDYEKIVNMLKDKYNINAYVQNSNTVAYCLKLVAEIMKKAGFKLPENFCFVPLNFGILGQYTPNTDTVSINSNKIDFYDLCKQNSMEESLIGYHPKTGHFLQTYLHEFSHAAHYKHLCDVHGIAEASRIFWGILSKKKPSEFIAGPLNNIFKVCIEGFKTTPEKIDKVFPVRNGVYALNDLTEYFAEQNARALAEKLGPYNIISNIPDDFASNYQGHPNYEDGFDAIEADIRQRAICNEKEEDAPTRIFRLFRDFVVNGNALNGPRMYSIEDALKGTVAHCTKEINYINGEIWNGNTEWLERKFNR